MTERKTIGYWTEKEERELRRSFEYAGAGEIHRTHVGDHPVTVTNDHRWFHANLRSTRIDSWFQNRIGACYGSNNRDKTPRPDTYSIQMDAYELARAVRRGDVVLGHEWKVEDTGRVYGEGCGASADEPICRVVVAS